MWQYEKKLQFPIKIKHANPKLAQMIISQYGGPNGRRETEKIGIAMLGTRDEILFFLQQD